MLSQINNKIKTFDQNKTQHNKVIEQILTPDYFLPSSHSESYYSKKYSGSTNVSNHKPLRTRLKQVATVSLIFLSMVTGEVFAGDKRPKSKAKPSRKQEATFAVTYLSNNLPDVVPDFPLPDLIPSNPPVTPPPPPPMPPLPDIVPPVILPDVVPVPPAPPMAPNMPDLLSDAAPKTKQKSGFMEAMKQIAKGKFKLKKVTQEPKPQVVSNNEADFMSQVLARREAITGEKKNNKFKKAAKQVIVLNAEEEKARASAIAKQIAENKEKAATLRKQKEKEWAIKAKQIEAEVEIEKQRKAAEHARAMREQKAKESGVDSSTVIAGIDPVLHKNMVADLRQEISSLKEQLQYYQLQLNEEKTRVVYTGTKNAYDKRKHKLSRKFTFLGYDFKPRIWHEKLVFTPGIGIGSLKKIRHQIKEQWSLKAKLSGSLGNMAKEVDVQISGWIEYYGHHRRSELYKLAYMIDYYLARFIKNKSKINNTWSKAWGRLMQIKAEHPKIFSHWYKICPSERRAV